MPSSTKKKRCVIFNPIQPVQVEHEVVSDRRASLLSGLVSPVVNTHLIGFVGNMRAVKRPEIFAKVIVDLNSRLRIPCVGVVIGEDRDGYTEKLERITRSINPPAEIILLGFQEDIEEWMPVCDVLIAPAVGEGFGRTLLEAMTLEVPVVASDSAGHKEIIHHCSNGLLVNSDNIGAFSDGVSELLSNKVFRKDIIAAGKKTARLYSTTKHSKGVRQVYASIKK